MLTEESPDCHNYIDHGSMDAAGTAGLALGPIPV